MTWRELIRLTLQDLRVYGTAQVPTPEDEQLATDHLNDWIDAQKNDGLFIYEQARTLWTLTAAASYTIGTGGTINVARPPSSEFIDGFAYVNNNLNPGLEFPLGPPLTGAQYAGIQYKSYSGQYPQAFYYEPTMAGGFGTVYPWPLPSSGNLQGVIYSGVAVPEISVITATIVLPPGYRRVLRLAGKVELYDAFKCKGIDPQKWSTELERALGGIRRTNEQLQDLSFGTAGRMFGRNRRGGENIYTGS